MVPVMHAFLQIFFEEDPVLDRFARHDREWRADS